MGSQRLLAVGVGLTLVGCGLPEILTAAPGSCPEAIDNAWPVYTPGEGETLSVPEDEIGYQVGQIPPDFNMRDQFGDEVCLRQLRGRYVVLDESGVWCIPCQKIAEHVACTQAALGDEVVYATLLSEGRNEGLPTGPGDLSAWSQQFDLDAGTLTPVLDASDRVFTNPFPGDALPSFLLLDPEQRVVIRGGGESVEVEIRNELAQRLGVSLDHCVDEP